MTAMIKAWAFIMICMVVVPGSEMFAQQTDVDSLKSEDVRQGGEDLKSLADNAYASGDYLLAIDLYEQIINNQGEAAAVYYNLANSYYKNSHIAKAIVNYERAAMMDPTDADIRFNLELAKSKTIDKITPKSRMFFISWLEGLVEWQNTNTWAVIAITAFIIMIVSTSLYLFNRTVRIRKIAFLLSVIALIVCVVANFASDYQKTKFESQKNAIVMVPSITIKSTPDKSGTDLFVLHEGCKVEIKDDSMQEWKEIELEDGNVGWIPANAIEII